MTKTPVVDAPILPVSGGPALERPSLSDATTKDVHRAGGVVVAAMATAHEAELVRLQLEASDIDAWLIDDNTTSIGSAMAIAVGGAKVVVADEDLDAARAVLDNAESAPLPAEAWGEGGGPTEDDRLPATPPAQKLANRALAAAVLGIMIPVLGNLYSMWLLVQLRGTQGGHTTASTGKALFALALNVTILGIYGWLFFG